MNSMASPPTVLVSRARPLLGTLVVLHAVPAPGVDATGAIEAAFRAIETIHTCMSAHQPDSDLGRLARASAGERVPVHPYTASVLRLARRWQVASAGAFDPGAAAVWLARRGLRPGLEAPGGAWGTLAGACIDAESVLVDGPLPLDLGGIAKGFAVDQAVEALRRQGIVHGLVNAGGDLRAFGERPWRVDLRHPVDWTRTRGLLRLREGAVASSVDSPETQFVRTRRRLQPWITCTVLARDCATADALTKWGMQAPSHSVQWRAALARAGAHAWRA